MPNIDDSKDTIPAPVIPEGQARQMMVAAVHLPNSVAA